MDRDGLQRKAMDEAGKLLGEVMHDASESRQDMAAMEKKIYGACNQLKAKLLQAWLDEAKDDSARPVCPHCGKRLRQKQASPKTCVCEGGQVEVRRTRWWCDSCQESFFPSGPDGDRSGLSGHA